MTFGMMKLALWTLSVLSASVQAVVTTSSQQQLLSSDLKVTLRDAVLSDLDDIVTIGVDAFSPGPGFRYTTPDYEHYKNYTWYCTREKTRKLWEEHWQEAFPKVITIPREGSLDASSKHDKAVAFAIWAPMRKGKKSTAGSLVNTMSGIVSHCADPKKVAAGGDNPPYDCSLQLGKNVTRAEYHQKQLTIIEEEYIFSQFTDHLYLAALATHPTWDGHNFGAMNLRWGIQYAQQESIPITLAATPAGYPLYKSFGFESLKNASFPMLDGEGELWYEVMRLESR